MISNIGGSKILPGNRELKTLLEKFKRNRICKVVFQCNTTARIKGSDDEINALLKNKSYLRRELTRGSKRDLLRIWARMVNIASWEKRRNAIAKIGKYIRAGFGIRLPLPLITYKHVPGISLREIKNSLYSATLNSLPRDIAYSVNSALKLVASRQRTISEILSNAKTMAQRVYYKCAGTPWCKDGKHLTRDLKDLGGLFEKVGSHNANDVQRPQTAMRQTKSWLVG